MDDTGHSSWANKTDFNDIYLICVQNLQERFVDVWLALESVLDLINIVDGMIKFHRLIVLQGWGCSQ